MLHFMTALAVQAAACSGVDAENVRLTVGPAPARQGESIGVRVRTEKTDAAIPLTCLSDWTISDPAVTLTPEGRLQIGEAARAGQRVRVSARLGERRLEAGFRIHAADAWTLAGYWRQESVACENGVVPAEPVRELRLYDYDRYAVTFYPFESRQDYWGSISFFQDTDHVGFGVEDGNTLPPDLELEGYLSSEGDDRLILDGFYLGQPSGEPVKTSCRYVFVRS